MRIQKVLLVVGAIIFIGVSVMFAVDILNKKMASKKTDITIGIIYKGSDFKPVVDGFKNGWNDIEKNGRTINYIEEEVSGIEQEDFDRVAANIASKKPDLIFAVAVEPIRGAQKATKESGIPVVFAFGGNPEKSGLVKTTQNPGENMTGITWRAWELSGKRLEILKEIDPRVKKIIIFGKAGSQSLATSLEYILPVAKELGIATMVKEVSTEKDFSETLSLVSRKTADAVYYAPDPFILRNADQLIANAIANKMPAIFHEERFTKKGALASYGANFEGAGKQATRLAAKIIMGGASPKDIPVETVLSLDLSVNLNTAKLIGITIPDSVLSNATTIIR